MTTLLYARWALRRGDGNLVTPEILIDPLTEGTSTSKQKAEHCLLDAKMIAHLLPRVDPGAKVLWAEWGIQFPDGGRIPVESWTS